MSKRKFRIDWLNHSLEFIVVLIGILIAFQLNQCSTDKQNKKTSDTHLEEIEKGLASITCIAQDMLFEVIVFLFNQATLTDILVPK